MTPGRRGEIGSSEDNFTKPYPTILHGVSGTVAASQSEGLRCLLHPIIPSLTATGYRNKSTFSVNRSPDGNPKTLGYYLGTWRGQFKTKLSKQTKNSQTVMEKEEETRIAVSTGVDHTVIVKKADGFGTAQAHEVDLG